MCIRGALTLFALLVLLALLRIPRFTTCVTGLFTGFAMPAVRGNRAARLRRYAPGMPSTRTMFGTPRALIFGVAHTARILTGHGRSLAFL